METFLRDFQFKILNNITCTNILLKKLGKVDSDVCSFCCHSREELEHLFYLCPFSQVFWIGFLKLFWFENMKEDITLSLKEIIIGFHGKDLDFINYCILVGKSVIYQRTCTCRRKEMKPTISLFKVMLYKKYETELYIAGKTNSLNKFHKKWKFKPLS